MSFSFEIAHKFKKQDNTSIVFICCSGIKIQAVHNDEIYNGFDVVFFDAFAPNKQPKLWEVEIFKKIFLAMNLNGILVTYCCQGQARRNMIEAGFVVEKVPGPPGKREMLRAKKL